jgi:hypothetical protein
MTGITMELLQRLKIKEIVALVGLFQLWARWNLIGTF